MKPVLRSLIVPYDHSFLMRKDIGINMRNNWHYHPEIELLFIRRSSGTWMIGDHIGHFIAGDIILLGANLPHCFRHDHPYIRQESGTTGESICIKFLPSFMGTSFLEVPEARHIKELLFNCNSGLKLLGETRHIIANMMDNLLMESSGKKLVGLLSMLEYIAESKEYIALSSKGFTLAVSEEDHIRIRNIFEYTFNDFNEKINIQKISSLLNMTRPSFCRYFKGKTGKTYVQFLMEVRIGHACRLLTENEKNVTEISYDCGYNNISHFNHQFKHITGKTPLQYRKDYVNNEKSAGHFNH